MAKKLKLIAGSKLGPDASLKSAISHAISNADTGAASPASSRTIIAADGQPAYTIIQSGSGPNLELKKTSGPEVRWTDTGQTDPAGRFRLRSTANVLVLEKALTASWATDVDILNIDTLANKAVTLQSFVDDGYLSLRGGPAAVSGSITINGKSHANVGYVAVSTPNAAASAGITRLTISGGAATAIATLAYCHLALSSGVAIQVTTGANESFLLRAYNTNDLAYVKAIEVKNNGVAGGGALMGFFGVTPVAQQPHIVDADGTLADITAKFNTLLSQLETLGLFAAV